MLVIKWADMAQREFILHAGSSYITIVAII